jgi:hypothetical protein
VVGKAIVTSAVREGRMQGVWPSLLLVFPPLHVDNLIDVILLSLGSPVPTKLCLKDRYDPI